MKAYIRSAAVVAPQDGSPDSPLLQEVLTYTGNRLTCAEPDYNQYIDPRAIRRMSRIIKMGTAAAMQCLKQAAVQMPGAITMGTAYGCLEDTGVFMKRMVEQQEEMLTPTSFIQSTHNTIGAQIALQLQCHAYNNTFVHRGFSFESALLDAMMLLEEGQKQVLTGAADEITPYSFSILQRFGLYKTDSGLNTDLYNRPAKGTMAGEGAAFFMLDSSEYAGNYAIVEGLHTFYKPGGTAAIKENIVRFLAANNLRPGDIDLLVTGRNGDVAGDRIYADVQEAIFPNQAAIGYKFLCGEYPTASAFALWMVARILKEQQVPAVFAVTPPTSLRRVLIYNHYEQIYHSLMLLQAC